MEISKNTKEKFIEQDGIVRKSTYIPKNKSQIQDIVDGEPVKEQRVLQIEEVYVKPTFLNKIVVYFLNIYEPLLICALISFGTTDHSIFAFIYQIVLQVLLYKSMRQMGAQAKNQRNITLVTIIGIFVIVCIKLIVMATKDDTINTDYIENPDLWAFFGFDVTSETSTIGNTTTTTYSFDRPKTTFFDFTYLVILLLLGVLYWSLIPKKNQPKKIKYIHNSIWLRTYMFSYFMYFALATLDVCVAINLIQLVTLCNIKFIIINLGLILLVMYVWAFRRLYKNTVTAKVVRWIKLIYMSQILCIQLFQIPYIKTFQEQSVNSSVLIILGLQLNYGDTDGSKYAAYTHVFLMVGVLAFAQLYETTYQNERLYFNLHGESAFEALKEPLIKKKDKKSNAPANENVRTRTKQIQASTVTQGNEQKKKKEVVEHKEEFTEKYQFEFKYYTHYISLWVLRFVCTFLGYYYYQSEGFFYINWVIFSLILPLRPFLKVTSYILLPFANLQFLYYYLININGLFSDDSIVFTKFRGIHYQYPVLETVSIFVSIAFMIQIIYSKRNLKENRTEFRIYMFQKLCSRESNFLHSLLFLFLKWLHVFVLFGVFYYGTQFMNIFYIGIMFMFIIYISSQDAYRKSGKFLIFYVGFYIWIQYFWELVQNIDWFANNIYFETFVAMLCYTSIDAEQSSHNAEVEVPTEKWVILFLFTIIYGVNWAFRYDYPEGKKDLNDIQYKSTALYYQDIKKKHFRNASPKCSNVLFWIAQILSDVMIIFILLCMGLLIMFQYPNLLFWGFLILSLTLQYVVVCANIQNDTIFRKCSRQALILKYYSFIVINMQVIYYFLTNDDFLSRYNIDFNLNNYLGELVTYMQFIGLLTTSEVNELSSDDTSTSTDSTGSTGNFATQIAFYVMAVFLYDHFNEQIDKIARAKKKQEMNDLAKMQSEILDGASKLFMKNDKDGVYQDIRENDFKEKIIDQYESVRYTLAFNIYKNINMWGFMDTICQNFYMIQAIVVLLLCTQWQVNAFMMVYLILNMFLCVRIARLLYQSGYKMSSDFYRQEVSVSKASKINKNYMNKAGQILIKERDFYWNFQYWFLIFCLIVMYLSPFLETYKDRITSTSETAEYTMNSIIFWVFWCGFYISPTDVSDPWSHLPYVLLIFTLLCDKFTQRWCQSRFGVSLEKVREWKILEEQVSIIKETGQFPKQIIEEDESYIPRVQPFTIPNQQSNKVDLMANYLSIGEARQEIMHIETLYREETTERREARLKTVLVNGIKKKYNSKLKVGMRIATEQITLLLLLLSCAYKCNIISILYMISLLFFLIKKDKTRNMIILTHVFGYLIAIQYFFLLMNLTTKSSPQKFPDEFQIYPNITEPQGQYLVPVYMKFDFLRDNIDWTTFFAIDVEKNLINNIWFDFVNLLLMTIYFFNYGSPITTKNVKVSFSSTKYLESSLHDYSQIQIERLAKKKLAADSETQKKYEDTFQDRREELKKKSLIPLELEQNKKLQGIEHDDQELDLLKDEFSEIAANDTIQYQQGATVYLQQLKTTITLYQLVKKSKFMLYIGLNIITILAIFLLAFINKTIMSIGYLVFATVMILEINNFFFQEELSNKGKKWKQPMIIKGPLLFYSFIDITLQILNQIPIGDEDAGTFTYFGFERIYSFVNPTTVADNSNGTLTSFEVYMTEELVNINYDYLGLLIVKCFNLFFIFMQLRIYESDAFKKFMKRDLRRLITLANSQKLYALAYRFNNWKLQKIASYQQRKKKINEGVANLKLRIKLWEETVFGRFAHKSFDQSVQQLKQPANQIPLLEDHPKEGGLYNKSPELSQKSSSFIDPVAEEKSKEQSKDQSNVQVFKRQRTKNVKFEASSLTSIDKIGNKLLKQVSEEDNKQKELLAKIKTYNRIKKKLPCCARFNLYLYDNYINKILFITTYERAFYLKKEMQKGGRAIYCTLEQALWNEISLVYQTVLRQKFIERERRNQAMKKKDKKEEKEVEDQVNIKDLPVTQEIIQFRNILRMNTAALMEAFVSNFSAFAYIFMICSMIISAGLISIVYPFAVFGYALIEETRPGKWFWDMMIKYTLFVLFAKFVFQLEFWQEIDGLPEAYNNINNWVLFGLWRCDTTGNLLYYIMPEILVLLCIMGQNYYEILLGVYTRRETEVENIKQARVRYLKARLGKKDQASTTMIDLRDQAEKQLEMVQEEVDEHGKNYRQRLREQHSDLQQVTDDIQKKRDKIKDDENLVYQEKDFNKKQLREDIEDYYPQRGYTLIDDTDVLYQQYKDISKQNQKARGFISKKFGKNKYLQRIFPTILQSKPGVDYYSSITGVQFLICYFLLNYYIYIDTEGTQNLENTSQFSINMVIVLFLQILVMVLERYINRTNTKQILKRIGMSDQIDKTEEDYLEQLKKDKTDLDTITKKMERTQTKISDNVLLNTIENAQLLSETPVIVLEETKLSPQQVCKFFLQYFLLIVNHILIFWYFPINSNYAIYGTPNCNTESSMYDDYGCLSFKQNIALNCFYLLFCWYFALSAFQLRYGLPDERKWTSLQKDYSGLVRWRWVIYYNLPFVVELKSMLDWCFSTTGIDLFQWIQLNVFQSEMYCAKVAGRNTMAKKYGARTSKTEKCICGCICLNIFAFFLLGPFIIFSNLSWIAASNLVTQASISAKVKFYDQNTRDSYQFPLYAGTNPLNMDVVTEEYFIEQGYNSNPNTKFFDYDQVQLIKMRNTSELSWSLSSEYQLKFQELLIETMNQSNPHMTTSFDFTYTFTRPYPDDATTATGTVSQSLDAASDNDYDILSNLYYAASLPCTTDPSASAYVNMKQFLVTELRLSQNVDVIILDDFEPKNLTLEYKCENYWSINVNGTGIVFTTFSDLISNNLFSETSILAFYFSVSYIVGTYFRSLFMYKGDRVFVVDSPYTDSMLNLLEAIQMVRIEKNIKKEEEYFHIVMEVLRSPELLKHLSGSHLREPL